MTVQRPEPERDTASVAQATKDLLAAVAGLDTAALAEPSLLPGWTRGHVLAHLARNADALVNLLTWARTGEPAAMYPPGDARDLDIEAGAGRPIDEQLADLRESAERFAQAAAAVPADRWDAQVAGRTIAFGANQVPWRRLVEVRLHHVDLNIGLDCAGLPADFAQRELTWLASGLRDREGVPAVELHDTTTGARWTIGPAAGPELTVSGPTGPLLAWVCGRGSGAELTVTPEGQLPALPPI